MPVSYPQKVRAAAAAANKKLVTLQAGSVVFESAVSEELESEIIRFILDIRQKAKGESGRATTPPSAETTDEPPH